MGIVGCFISEQICSYDIATEIGEAFELDQLGLYLRTMYSLLLRDTLCLLNTKANNSVCSSIRIAKEREGNNQVPNGDRD